MSKCTNCKKNIAVVYTTRFENGKKFNEGLCIKCAYTSGLGSMDDMFSSAGINENNIDEITERINNVMGGANLENPENLLKMIVEGSIGNEKPFFDFNEDEDEDEDDNVDGIQKSNTLKAELLPVSNAFPNDEDANNEGNDKEKIKKLINDKDKPKREKRKFLDQFGTNLNIKASEGKIDRIIGREKEIERVVQILNRRNKNNPVLLGEPGVGKTAIAEGLAVRITQGTVPVKLKNLEIYLLDMTAMVAGTQFRGQFEVRMKGVVDEAVKSGNIVIVIDELHNIMGAGDAEGAMNAANILKPALAKGDIKILGSTTLNDYRKFIEKDSALERRFQQVLVEEPTKEESIEILQGIKDYYEKHHKVIYEDKAIQAAVELSDRYITDRFLPDKAIDLLDEAGSRASLNDLCDISIHDSKLKIESLESQQQLIESQLIDFSDNLELYEKQAKLKEDICKEEDNLNKMESEYQPTTITENDIAMVVEMWTKIPVQRISETETRKLLELENRLHEKIIGQEQAVIAVSKAIRRNRAGFRKKHKPSSFIFVGPTGVGKTELVKALAWAMFESEDAMIRLDMSEFMEPHTVSKLIGSPPGYVGYDDGGQLTERVRRKPYSVILFDEIEKAHADVYNMLLQILDDGRLTDSHGRVVNFENSIIIMTSNAGTTLKAHGIGFTSNNHLAMESRVQTVLREIFRPEFLNRVDEVIVFNELSNEEIRKICDLMMKDIITGFGSRDIKFMVSDEVKDYLAHKGYDVKFGARPLRKTIQKEIEDPLADMMLTGKLDGVIGVSAVMKDGQIHFDTL